jgi:drug/metabolite transporter (DMT)-like permease
MLYVFLSVLCSVIVSVLLKLAKRYQIDVFQAITWNYSIAILLTWFFFKPSLQFATFKYAPYSILIPLGILLPVIFFALAASVRVAGIVRTDVAQRLSLFVSLSAAFLLFDDHLNSLKFIGIAVGLAAILCSIPWQKKTANRKVMSNAWLYLVLVFLGFGFIDILFKQVAAFKQMPFTTLQFLAFIVAFVVALIILLIRRARNLSKITYTHVFFGWILGVANFGNIFFYLRAHKALSNSPSTVFTGMNIGVIALGTLVGLVLFNERLSLLNKVGVALAIVAIIIITISNH